MRRAFWLVLLVVPASVTATAAMKRLSRDEGVLVHEARVAAMPRRAELAMPDRGSRAADGGSADAMPMNDPPSAIGDPQSEARVPAELASYSRTSGKRTAFGALAWAPGAAWTVESRYLQMQNGRSDWSLVIAWKYAVRGVEKIEGVEAYVVDVEPLTAMPYNAGGAMYISTADHSVVAVRDRVLERGRVRERTVRFDDAAVSVLFPTELPSRDAEARERAGAVPMPANPFGPKLDVPAAATVVDVAFESNGTTIRQRWDAANRLWPLVSTTPSRISVLK